MKRNIKHLDTFSGYGGFTQAVGGDTIGFSEIEKHAIAVLKYHYPEIKNYGSITEIDPASLPDFDLLTGGSPCQDLSVAGKQAGGLGAKTGLYAVPVLTPDRLEKRQNGRRFKTDGDPSFTLTAQDRHGVYDGNNIRRLMPIECERLMGLPDNWTLTGINEKGEEYRLSDSARYKLCGNGVVVNVVKAIIEKLYEGAKDKPHPPT
jgi:site-specific DNA-cytosine methylase